MRSAGEQGVVMTHRIQGLCCDFNAPHRNHRGFNQPTRSGLYAVSAVLPVRF
jgi:hypothetical protein